MNPSTPPRQQKQTLSEKTPKSTSKKKEHAKKQRQVTARKIEKGETLAATGDDEGALDAYFDVIERNPSSMKRNEKLDMQKKIAKSIKKLGWKC